MDSLLSPQSKERCIILCRISPETPQAECKGVADDIKARIESALTDVGIEIEEGKGNEIPVRGRKESVRKICAELLEPGAIVVVDPFASGKRPQKPTNAIVQRK
jgi:hypothetical protein